MCIAVKLSGRLVVKRRWKIKFRSSSACFFRPFKDGEILSGDLAVVVIIMQ